MVTVITQFETEPDLQQELIEMLRRTLPMLAYQPGFRGASLYAGQDGARVVQHAEWEAVQDYEASVRNPDLISAGSELAQFVASGWATMDVLAFDRVENTPAPR